MATYVGINTTEMYINGSLVFSEFKQTKESYFRVILRDDRNFRITEINTESDGRSMTVYYWDVPVQEDNILYSRHLGYVQIYYYPVRNFYR